MEPQQRLPLHLFCLVGVLDDGEHVLQALVVGADPDTALYEYIWKLFGVPSMSDKACNVEPRSKINHGGTSDFTTAMQLVIWWRAVQGAVSIMVGKVKCRASDETVVTQRAQSLKQTLQALLTVTIPEAVKMTKDSNLPTMHRFVTDHNDQGKAIFHPDVEEVLSFKDIPNSARFGLGYTTSHYPVDMSGDADVKAYKEYQSTPPGIVVPGGTVLRVVDSPPGALSPMHRTVSLDYGVVLEGEFELILDSGEVRTMKKGDIAVQRGTMHAWKNTSQTEWGRMMYVLQESKPLEVAGTKLGEDLGDMEGVPPSGN